MAIRRKTGGRSKGTQNRTTTETKELLQKIVNKEIDSLSLLLEQLEPNDRINALSKLLPYIVPKQNEITANVSANVMAINNYTHEERKARIKELIAKAEKK